MSGDIPPPQVKAEYVTMDGPEGEALEERQLTAITEVLRWLLRDTPPQNEDTGTK